jgi:hypothetical protein
VSSFSLYSFNESSVPVRKYWFSVCGAPWSSYLRVSVKSLKWMSSNDGLFVLPWVTPLTAVWVQMELGPSFLPWHRITNEDRVFWNIRMHSLIKSLNRWCKLNGCFMVRVGEVNKSHFQKN